MVKFISDDEYGGMMATNRTRAGKKHKVSITALGRQ
jgi:hypothetical protein